MIKRLFDIICSFIGILVFLPLFAIISIMVKRSSPGPILYLANRVGINGKLIKIYKFRTMLQDADKKGGPSTAADDPRLTKNGKFLKKFQLDELPQLFNVFLGSMSLVGPRPEVPLYVDMMSSEEREIILSVKPGMTDWASLWNFHEAEILKGSADPEKKYMEEIRPKKINLQIKYVKERSLWIDIKIIFLTIFKLYAD